jgi:LPPG:FO 2-phospho-L-lactate transferase
VPRDLFDAVHVEAAIICPSNPYVSIAPMLALSEIRDWLERRTFPVVAVSPIIGGDAVKGPAAKMMRELGLAASASAVAEHYGALVDGWVIDRRDQNLAPAIEARGRKVVVAETLMTDRGRSLELARTVVELAARLGARPT